MPTFACRETWVGCPGRPLGGPVNQSSVVRTASRPVSHAKNQQQSQVNSGHRRRDPGLHRRDERAGFSESAGSFCRGKRPHQDNLDHNCRHRYKASHPRSLHIKDGDASRLPPIKATRLVGAAQPTATSRKSYKRHPPTRLPWIGTPQNITQPV